MIPTSINICGIPHEIRLCEDNFISTNVHFGEIDIKHCVIKLDKNMPEPMQLQTLMHEWLHGALCAIGQEELRENETVVQGLAAAMYQTFEVKLEQSKEGERD